MGSRDRLPGQTNQPSGTR